MGLFGMTTLLNPMATSGDTPAVHSLYFLLQVLLASSLWIKGSSQDPKAYQRFSLICLSCLHINLQFPADPDIAFLIVEPFFVFNSYLNKLSKMTNHTSLSPSCNLAELRRGHRLNLHTPPVGTQVFWHPLPPNYWVWTHGLHMPHQYFTATS